MKKVLISILIVLLLVLAYFAIFNGLSFGDMEVLSVQQIIDANDELTSDIEQASTLLKKDYPAKKEELSKSVSDLLEEKEKYFKLAKVSTEGEIAKASTVEKYYVEYLWMRVGNHAKSKGVNIKMDQHSGDTGEADVKNYAFTVTGQYQGIILFISALENDSKLNFRIENFRLTGSGLLTATFNVRNIRIKTETGATTTQTTNDNDTTTTKDETQNDGTKFNQVTGAIDGILAPTGNN